LEAELKIYSAAFAGRDVWEWPVASQGWRRAAKAVLSAGAFGYIAGSAGQESTAHANRRAFQGCAVRPRMLRNVERRDLSVTLLGRKMAVPLVAAPIGVQSIIHPAADRASAAAAAQSEIPYIASTVSSVPLEDIAKAMGEAPRWFQLYPGKNPDIVASFLARAEAAGYSAVVVTVDTTMLGWRTHDLQNVYLPFLRGEGLANFLTDPVFRAKLQKPPEEDMGAAVQEFLSVYVNPAFTWDDLAHVKAMTRLPVLVKGITHPEDAATALDLGLDGLIVSNHGGRQVDGAVASLTALLAILERVGREPLVLLDSGVRSAADVMKALALGADAVGVGRPYAYALAVGGEAGVRELFSQWKAELDLQLALSGYTAISQLGPEAVAFNS
jgi:lactate 2-monooxygenase